MRSLSDYRYWKFHFDCLKASNFRSEKPMGSIWPLPPQLGRSRVIIIIIMAILVTWPKSCKKTSVFKQITRINPWVTTTAYWNITFLETSVFRAMTPSTVRILLWSNWGLAAAIAIKTETKAAQQSIKRLSVVFVEYVVNKRIEEGIR